MALLELILGLESMCILRGVPTPRRSYGHSRLRLQFLLLFAEYKEHQLWEGSSVSLVLVSYSDSSPL